MPSVQPFKKTLSSTMRGLSFLNQYNYLLVKTLKKCFILEDICLELL